MARVDGVPWPGPRDMGIAAQWLYATPVPRFASTLGQTDPGGDSPAEASVRRVADWLCALADAADHD